MGSNCYDACRTSDHIKTIALNEGCPLIIKNKSIRKLLFIENPNSGTGKSSITNDLLSSTITGSDWSLVYTQYAGHAKEIASKHIGSVDVVVAIGGDGTINEISSVMTNTDVALGIIPRGSGNGLARFLGIPINHTEALDVILNGNVRKIDTMKLNDHHFVNVAGIGFDAHIAQLFQNYGSRGFLSYAKLVLSEFQKYSGITVSIGANQIERSFENVFVISIANSSQYGNNAHIAPQAVIDDGKADISVVDRFPLSAVPSSIKIFIYEAD